MFTIKEEKSLHSDRKLITIKYLNETIFYKGFDKNEVLDIDMITSQALRDLCKVLKVESVPLKLYKELLTCVNSFMVETTIDLIVPNNKHELDKIKEDKMKYIKRVLKNIKELKLNNAWVLEIEKEKKKLEYLTLDYLYNKSPNNSILNKYKNTRIENANIDLQVSIMKMRGEV